MRTLVVGANGDVGSRTCLALLERGVEVRGSVRTRARAGTLAASGVELMEADLVSASGWPTVLAGVDVMVMTANAVAPRRGDDPRQVEAGLLRLVEDAARAGVGRIVLASVPVGPIDDRVPVVRARRHLEQRVLEAGPEPVVLRFPPFMDAWLALVGSSVPLRGAEHATIGRPSPFLRTFRRATGTLVEHRGLMLVPGSAAHRNAFIAADDVAAALAGAVTADRAPSVPLEVGGPEVLSWRDVADSYATLLDRAVRILSTPAAAYAAMAVVLRPAGVVPASTMALNRYLAVTETPWRPTDLIDPGSLTTVRDFLAARLALPDVLPEVP